MENAEKKIENAELLRSKAEQVANATQVGENTAQRIGDIFRLIADIISQMLNGGTEMSKTDKTQNEKIENIEKTLKTLQDSVASNNQNATNAEAIKSVKQLVERLQEQLNTIVGENATTAIDNFNEIKNFLAGLKDSDTLTALLAKVNERLIALERAKPSTDVLEVLEFDGFTDRAVAVQMESATGDFKVLFDAKNKRFVAKINGQNNYSAGWLSEGEATSTDSDYQARGSNPRPFAKKIYINRANNTSYRWNGEELVQINASNNALKPHINKLTRALEKPKLVENGEFQGVLEYVQDIQPYREIDTDFYRGME